MVHYNCIRCGYETTHKSKMISHLNRKYICKPNISDATIEKMHELNLVSRKKYPSTIYNDTLKEYIPIIYENIDIEEKLHSTICKYCFKNFSSYKNKWRHEKHNCKKKKSKDIPIKVNDNDNYKYKIIHDSKKIDLSLLIKQLEEKDKQINELIKKINNSTVINNIQILPYNNTNKGYITDKMISECMEKQNRCISEMIKLVHFNVKHPENMNILIRNIRTEYIMIFNGKDWIFKDRDEMFDKIISDNEKFLHKIFLEWYDDAKLSTKYNNAIEKFEKYLNVSSNQDIIDSVKKELKLMCYNAKRNKLNDSDYFVTELIT
jgi:hypothetical protein